MTISATSLNWETDVSVHLHPTEWPRNTLEWMAARVVLSLSEARMKSKARMYPSPAPGGHVRHRDRRAGNGDRHSTDNGKRLSDATDFFVRWPEAPVVYRVLQSIPDIRGIGIYDAMRFRNGAGAYAMFHIDVPPPGEPRSRVLWVGHGRDPVEYISQGQTPFRHYELIAAMLRGNQ